MERASRLAMWAVIAHYAVNTAHGMAHSELAIPLSRWQETFIAAVILATPALAWLLIWREALKLGGWLLLVSTAAALVFGAWYHFIAISPDHVAHLPTAAPAQCKMTFQVTAGLLIPAEAFGVWAGYRLARTRE